MEKKVLNIVTDCGVRSTELQRKAVEAMAIATFGNGVKIDRFANAWASLTIAEFRQFANGLKTLGIEEVDIIYIDKGTKKRYNVHSIQVSDLWSYSDVIGPNNFTIVTAKGGSVLDLCFSFEKDYREVEN